MEKINLLRGYFAKQIPVIQRLHNETTAIDLEIYENRYVFALKIQQMYTAIEDLLKSTAGTFENSADDYPRYHYELLKILSTNIPDIRPALFSSESYEILNKVRTFRHFIRHGYDYILDKEELQLLQNKINSKFALIMNDLNLFADFLEQIIKSS